MVQSRTSLQSRDHPRSLRVTGAERSRPPKGREDASVVAIRRKGNYFASNYKNILSRIQVCDCQFPRINRSSQHPPGGEASVGPTSPLPEAPSIRRFSPERYGRCRIPVPTPTPPDRPRAAPYRPVRAGYPRRATPTHSGPPFPRGILGCQGLRSQHNHMIVTYGHMQRTRADRSHACGYINNCTCPPPESKVGRSASNKAVESTRPFRCEHTVPPLLTAHLSYQETRRERLEYNPDVKVCVLAGLRNESAFSLGPKGRRRQAAPRVRGLVSTT